MIRCTTTVCTYVLVLVCACIGAQEVEQTGHIDPNESTSDQTATDAWANSELLAGTINATGNSRDVTAKIQELIALQEYEKAIELASNELVRVERANGRFDIALVQPLVLLGDCKVVMGDHQDALTFYHRARDLNRQNLGLHALSQVNILYKEADAFLNQGMVNEANDRHEYAYSLFIRQFGVNSAEQLPGLFSLADWYTDTYNIFAARGLYEHAVRLARENLDESDAKVLRALRGLARTYKLEKFRPSIIPDSAKAITARPYGSLNSIYHYRADVNNFAPGEQALIDIVNIEMSRSDAGILDIAHAKLDLADWYLLFEKYDKAQFMYHDIWEMFGDHPTSTFIQIELTEPKLLFKPVPLDDFDRTSDPDADITTARVEMKLTVTARGRTRNVEQALVEPPDAPTSDTKASAKKARYRPAFVDGAPVTTDDVSFVHTFEYTR